MLGGIAETRIMKTNTDAQAFVISDSTGPRGRREKENREGIKMQICKCEGNTNAVVCVGKKCKGVGGAL